MTDQTIEIQAGGRTVYEVVKSEETGTVSIRHAEDHNHSVQLIDSVIPTLIRALQDIQRR